MNKINSKKVSVWHRFCAHKSGAVGFTLIEMLIVVAIIGILASAIMVGLGPAQQKGRDARRMSDLSQAQNALELYYTQNSQYPNNGNNTVMTFTELASLANNFTSVGVSNFPTQGPSKDDYCYQAISNSSYIIGTHLEAPSASDTSHSCTTLTSCGNVTNLNYCVSF